MWTPDNNTISGWYGFAARWTLVARFSQIEG
jgi:hypothetical protein